MSMGGPPGPCVTQNLVVHASRKPVYWHAMNPKYKRAFIVVALVWMAPYFGFVGYYSLQFPLGHWPSWLIFTATSWLIANAVGIMPLVLAIKRIFPR